MKKMDVNIQRCLRSAKQICQKGDMAIYVHVISELTFKVYFPSIVLVEENSSHAKSFWFLP